jgi:hypothetical protein
MRRNPFLGRNLMVELEEKKTNFKANISELWCPSHTNLKS